MEIVYRAPNNASETEAAAKIESDSLTTAWTQKQIEEIPDYGVYLIALDGKIVCGIASMYIIAGEGQIMNIAVNKDFRKRGIAFGLMKALEEKAKESNCDIITLEVANNNESAISLYKKCGYSAIGTRKGFYNGIDALIMEKNL